MADRPQFKRADQGEPMTRLLARLSVRRCHGCEDSDPHSHHLTWLGRWRYCGTVRGRG